jgi:hypothetical protein
MLGVLSFDAARYGPAAVLAAVNPAAQETGCPISAIPVGTAGHDAVVEAAGRLSAEDAEGVIAIARVRRSSAPPHGR